MPLQANVLAAPSLLIRDVRGSDRNTAGARTTGTIYIAERDVLATGTDAGGRVAESTSAPCRLSAIADRNQFALKDTLFSAAVFVGLFTSAATVLSQIF